MLSNLQGYDRCMVIPQSDTNATNTRQRHKRIDISLCKRCPWRPKNNITLLLPQPISTDFFCLVIILLRAKRYIVIASMNITIIMRKIMTDCIDDSLWFLRTCCAIKVTYTRIVNKKWEIITRKNHHLLAK